MMKQWKSWGLEAKFPLFPLPQLPLRACGNEHGVTVNQGVHVAPAGKGEAETPGRQHELRGSSDLGSDQSLPLIQLCGLG